MISQLSEAFILGLSVAPACLGYCAPVCVPLLACEQRPWKAGARVLGLFLLGRLAGYSVVGLLVGAAGTLLLSKISVAVWGGIRVLMGVLLIIFGLFNDSPRFRWFVKPGGNPASPWFAASLGLLTGLNLCPPFGAAIASAAATASITHALFYFWAFFAGTAVCFAPLLAITPFSRIDTLRQIARICLFLAGIWLVLEGLWAGIASIE
jgi:sulfite exporter TauE/SafE